MSVEDILKLVFESLGEGKYERARDLLAQRLGEDPSSVLLRDPSRFLWGLRESLGREAEDLLVAMAAVLRARGRDIDKEKLEELLKGGDREAVRSIFLNQGSRGGIYGKLLANRLDEIRRRRIKITILSSILLGAGIFLLTFLMVLALGYYIPPNFRTGVLSLGAIISIILAIENYIINMPRTSARGFPIKIAVIDPEALKGSMLSTLSHRRPGEVVEIDIVNLSIDLSVAPAELINEINRLMREGKIAIKF